MLFNSHKSVSQYYSVVYLRHYGVFLWGRDLSAISQHGEVRREGKQSRHKRQHYSPADLRYILL